MSCNVKSRFKNSSPDVLTFPISTWGGTKTNMVSCVYILLDGSLPNMYVICCAGGLWYYVTT